MSWRVIHGDCVEAMRAMAPASVDTVVTDLAAGTAGEHLVCADLLMQGYRVFRTEQTCPYDVAVEHERRLIRLQVKTTRGLRAVPQRVNQRDAYFWHVRRAGKGGARRYSGADFDLLALVALDCRRVAYLPLADVRQTVVIRAHGDPAPPVNGGKSGRTFDQLPFARALAGLAERECACRQLGV